MLCKRRNGQKNGNTVGLKKSGMELLTPVPLQVVCRQIVVISYLCIVCDQHCDDSHEHCADAYIGGAPSTSTDKDISDDIVIGPMPHARTPPSGDKQTRAAQIQAAFLCGVINAIITIPVMTSFAAIIFQVDTTQPYHACESLKYHVGTCCFASSSKQHAVQVHMYVPAHVIWLKLTEAPLVAVATCAHSHGMDPASMDAQLRKAHAQNQLRVSTLTCICAGCETWYLYSDSRHHMASTASQQANPNCLWVTPVSS